MVGETLIPTLLTIAWLLPLLGFAVEMLYGRKGERTTTKWPAWCAVACIGTGFLCSLIALLTWGQATGWAVLESHDLHGPDQHHSEDDPHHHGDSPKHQASTNESGWQMTALTATENSDDAEHVPFPSVYSGTLYTLGVFGSLVVSIDYYIDSLTLVMFTMVTLIATCIHLFAMGYMSDELTNEYVDHFAHTSDGKHVHRPGRFYRFFAYMSLFCFSMLGLVLAGNIFQVFVFWELVGICSYLLIGFYTERKSAGDAANKAFIMNRIGDFGFLIGLMVVWTWFGTFQFSELFDSLPRDATGHIVTNDLGEVAVSTHSGESRSIPYSLLVVAGLGVFAGCIGKSAQFPLQTWLPDAMEGPTPVSALVHSATMVAAGVYLVGRFYPMFVPEVLLTIAYIGAITLFLAATIAVVATDIKRVLAYSTISQLGYMMLGLGVFGWAAGLFHLITHAFFKSLMFLCSGSVIHGCHHEQEMPKMGGLMRKMPITAGTMLIGVIAISGLAVPGLIAFSGYHSKDAIVATALAFIQANPAHFLLFLLPLLTAGITAFYMFRLWFYTFFGEPRDQHIYDHAHESPWIMTAPLLVLAVFAAGCAIGGEKGMLYMMLLGSEPVHVANGVPAATVGELVLPGHSAIHDVHAKAGMWALLAAISGTLLAYVLYGTKTVNLSDMKRQLAGIHQFLSEKWYFDELYHALFMKPVHQVAALFAWIDRTMIDRVVHASAGLMVKISKWDRFFDETFVDGLVNLIARATFSSGILLKAVQTGRLRQYVMFIVVGVVALFAVLFTTFPN
ncbi:MAG: NADH-quinone oxidoreductase subunit L [Fuerstiella sp.]|nr:NADH-quinone oxidoreductase subunit L [Fuerstiella sp.]